MKTKEELNALKEEAETVNRKLAELTEAEMEQIFGGNEDGNSHFDYLMSWLDGIEKMAQVNNFRSVDDLERFRADCEKLRNKPYSFFEKAYHLTPEQYDIVFHRINEIIP